MSRSDGRIKVDDAIRDEARKLLGKKVGTDDSRRRLKAIVAGELRTISSVWWLTLNLGADLKLRQKLYRMSDPERNDNAHERAVAAEKLAKLSNRPIPGVPPRKPTPDNVTAKPTPDNVTAKPTAKPTPDNVTKPTPDSVTAKPTPDSAKRRDSAAAHAARARQRLATRTGLVCQSCGAPLAAQRVTARYCGATCRQRSHRHPIA
jgi:hypothetical protein